jgi:hypothetical protein
MTLTMRFDRLPLRIIISKPELQKRRDEFKHDVFSIKFHGLEPDWVVDLAGAQFGLMDSFVEYDVYATRTDKNNFSLKPLGYAHSSELEQIDHSKPF